MNIKEITKKNGTKVYRASVYLGVDRLTGKKARTTVTAQTKKGVKAKAREVQNKFIDNGYTVKEKVTVKTYKELVELWWDSYKNTIKVNTQHSTRSFLDIHLLPVFGSYRLDKITTPLIQQVVNKWADRANRNVKGAFSHYGMLHRLNKRILQYGVTMQLLEHNPANNVSVPRNKQSREKAKLKFLDKEELKQFLTYLDSLNLGKYQNLFDVVLYKFLLATGCRIGEALALEWSDIDLDNGNVNINKTLNLSHTTNAPKSKVGYRDISIDKATVLMLRQYKNRQRVQSMELVRTETTVFSVFTNKYASPFVLRERLMKHYKNAGVTNVAFHGLRHTHATMMLYAGIQPKDLQKRLGHSDISMTLNTYVHATEEGAKQSATFFEKAMSEL